MVKIIAEAGTNHNGRFDTAKQLVQVAAESKADFVKFQAIYPEGLYLPAFFKDGAYEPWDVFQKRKERMLSDEEYLKLGQYAVDGGIPMTASIFDEKGIALLEKMNAPFIKIASTDLNHSRLLKKAGETGKLVIVSTGMSTLCEVERAVKDFLFTGNQKLVLMHCVSAYPCDLAMTNLGFISILKEAFGLPVGFSDHTGSSLAAGVAVSMGAEWIEKHFTLDRKQDGFDHAYAMEPAMLKDYVQDIRNVETALTRPVEKLGDSEKAVMNRARRGGYAARDIRKGEILAEGDILIVRPPAFLTPNECDAIIGKRVLKDIRRYKPLKREEVGE